MLKISLLLIFVSFSSCSILKKKVVTKKKSISHKKNEIAKTIIEKDLYKVCKENLNSLPGKHDLQALDQVCSRVSQKSVCKSTKEVSIFHYEKSGSNPHKARILAFGTIHGDEESSGTIIRAWMERLSKINPRSTWRLIPILNPDGRKLKTRMNYNKVDLNRNFPTKDWIIESKEYWEKRVKKNPRRYPGPAPASEIETQCAISHINDFQPDLIISIHTPLGVLDFDGPKMNFPSYKLLPWKRLGHFPGSLGRYMWRDHKVPVLTVELKGSNPIANLKAIDQLQDLSGLVALMTKWNK